MFCVYQPSHAPPPPALADYIEGIPLSPLSSIRTIELGGDSQVSAHPTNPWENTHLIFLTDQPIQRMTRINPFEKRNILKEGKFPQVWKRVARAPTHHHPPPWIQIKEKMCGYESLTIFLVKLNWHLDEKWNYISRVLARRKMWTWRSVYCVHCKKGPTIGIVIIAAQGVMGKKNLEIFNSTPRHLTGIMISWTYFLCHDRTMK